MERLTAALAQQQATVGLRELVPLVPLADGRVAVPGHPTPWLDFSSNDYLGYSQHPEVKAAAAAALDRYGAGAGASRLMSGDRPLFHELEDALARLVGCESALLFGAGFLANTGVIPVLVGRGDTVLADRASHASLLDGCRLAGARLIRFRHNDAGHLEELLIRERPRCRQALIVAESLYSMDGDLAPLADLVAMKHRFDAMLLVDEAHSVGVFGARGGGLLEELGLAAGADVVIGTLGKALGSSGAFAAGSRLLRQALINQARTFIFSTAPPPAAAAAALAAVALLAREPERRRDLRVRAAGFRQALAAAGLAMGPALAQIQPILVGDSLRAVALRDRLRREGLFVTAVRPPTVPAGTARIRFSVTWQHSAEQLAATARQVAAACQGIES
ncbi:MAG: 8-amino-7-oxononanoate synthase [Thermodesulfobacteriota bacterium]